MLAGAYVVYYWAFFPLPGSDTRTSGRSLIDRGEAFSSQAATWLGSATGKTVVSIVLVALGALALWALRRRLFRAPQSTGYAVVATAPIREPSEPGGSQHGPLSTRA